MSFALTSWVLVACIDDELLCTVVVLREKISSHSLPSGIYIVVKIESLTSTAWVHWLLGLFRIRDRPILCMNYYLWLRRVSVDPVFGSLVRPHIVQGPFLYGRVVMDGQWLPLANELNT